MAQERINFRDLQINGNAPDETGRVPVDAWLRLAVATMQNGDELFIPNPAGGAYLLDWDAAHPDGKTGPILIYDDNAGGNKKGHCCPVK